MEVDQDGIAHVVVSEKIFAVEPNAADLCRLCANTDNQLIPIFKGEGLEHNIHNKIKKHLPIISVSESDKLPLQVCYQCASTLISWHNLYEGSSVADKRLRDLLDETYEDETFDTYVGMSDHSYGNKSKHDESLAQPSIAYLRTDKLIVNVNTDEVHPVESVNIEESVIESSGEERSVETNTHNEHRQSMENVRCLPHHCTEAPLTELVVRDLEDVPITSTCECDQEKNGDSKCSLCATRDNQLRCNLCPMVFIVKRNLEHHLRNSHSNLYSQENVVSTSAIPRQKRVKKTTQSVAIKSDKPALPSLNKKTAANFQNIAAGATENVHQCKVCLKICLSSRGLIRHSVVHKSFFCGYCSESFPSDTQRNKHVTDFHRINVPSLKAEPNENGNEADVNLMKMEVNVDIICDEEELEVKEDCNSLLEEAPNSKTVNCLECNKTFTTRQLLTNHQKIHLVKIECTCDQCSKQFSSDRLLRRHLRSVHHVKGLKKLPEKDDPFVRWYVFADGRKHLKCDQCKYNSPWYNKGRFLEHYRIHTGEKPFTCDLCGKQFRTKTLLQKHVMYVHEGIKEHPCDICGRRFSDKRYMADHRRIHTGERPYVCDLCGKTFKQSASLFIHKELHKGLRKHACDMCPKRFTTRSSLNIHIKRHVGERNFICAVCGKAFVDGKHLKDHMAVHSDERPFACELCGGRFKLLKHLKQHGRTHKRDFVS